MAQPLTVVARMIAAPQHRDVLMAEMTTLVAETREEPGCIRYDLMQNTESPDIFVFVEEWESPELWRAHMDGAAVRGFNSRIPAGAIVEGEVHPLVQVV
ncbi:MAG: putative quinol monooxygenase [Pseudomonadota bacterium]